MTSDSTVPAATHIPTNTPHVGVREALRLLTRVLAEPQAGRVNDDLADEVADIVGALVDVQPPMPPLAYPQRSVDDDEQALCLVGCAMRQLLLAVTDSPDPQERLRAAIAARRLIALSEGHRR